MQVITFVVAATVAFAQSTSSEATTAATTITCHHRFVGERNGNCDCRRHHFPRCLPLLETLTLPVSSRIFQSCGLSCFINQYPEVVAAVGAATGTAGIDGATKLAIETICRNGTFADIYGNCIKRDCNVTDADKSNVLIRLVSEACAAVAASIPTATASATATTLATTTVAAKTATTTTVAQSSAFTSVLAAGCVAALAFFL
ncbi:hypothetical protein BDR26DRAFT_897167 [Obelidium mucronatum]|nr:hypothetical protein BDR26DRAFT_897167 [Obelidium mucronatum]